MYQPFQSLTLALVGQSLSHSPRWSPVLSQLAECLTLQRVQNLSAAESVDGLLLLADSFDAKLQQACVTWAQEQKKIVLVLLTTSDEAAFEQWLAAGVDDCLLAHEASCSRLMHSLYCAKQLMQSREMITAETLLSADKEPLLDRHHFAKAVDALLLQTAIQQRSALLCIDIDDFREINQLWGYHIGDQLLQAVVKRIQKALGPPTLLARLDGDEFAVFLPDGDEAHAGHMAMLLCQTLGEPYYVYDQEIRIHVSIGIACYPKAGQDYLTLCCHAEVSMRGAKAAGGNDMRYYTAELYQNFLANLRMENALMAAVKEDEFFLCYQPQLALSSGKLAGVEVLLRWQRPGVGIVNPAEFIARAEDTGVISAVGHWLLSRALQELATLGASVRDLKLSINLAAKQMLAPEFKSIISRVVQAPVWDRSQVVFELTESEQMSQPRLQQTIEWLHTQGFSLAVDDFGTGYSSLSYLTILPLDIVKIDKLFVDGLAKGEKEHALLQAMLAMAKTMGYTVVVEGVETQGQYDYLQARGCDLIQGYYYSPPLSLSELKTFIEAPHAGL